MGSRTDCHESAGESESIFFFIAWGAEGRYLFCVCSSGLGIFMYLLSNIMSLFFWFCMSIYSVRGGMQDTELGDRGRGKKMFCWAGSVE